jgi:hypothetical protein
MAEQLNNPLHGKTLESILTHLVDQYGWDELGDRIPVNCFLNNPSIKSSLAIFQKNTVGEKKDRRSLPGFTSLIVQNKPIRILDQKNVVRLLREIKIDA